jgi:hypothetical protein
MPDARQTVAGMAFVVLVLQALRGLTPWRVRVIIRPVGPTIWSHDRGREALALDDKLHQMLRDLRRALSDAISESPDVSRTLRRIREEGYSLYLLVDCKRDLLGDDDPLPVASRRGERERDPVFQINSPDLHFLRSIGIDPTRRSRRRRPLDDL